MEDTKKMPEFEFKSSIDGSREKFLFHRADDEEDPRPLLVGLHTWSADRFNQVKEMLHRCQERNWHLLLPEFRGPNLVENPRANEACASKAAKQDIIDALEEIIGQANVDTDNIFLLGGSGGGHMALMMAAYEPKRWRGVSSWCPITDLAKWHEQKKETNFNYAKGIEACCGGTPGQSPEINKEYEERSPIHNIHGMKQANLYVHHGRFDKSVPYTHTLDLAIKLDALEPERFFFEIFDGAHELHYDRAFDCFDELFETEIDESQLSG